MRRALLATAALLLAACATGYHPQGFSGGYSDLQLGEDVFRVEFNGNGYTGGARAADFALLRCAELAMQHGYTHFIIIDVAHHASKSTYTTPTTTTTTGTVNTYGSGGTVNATSTTTGGQTYVITKPSTQNTIVCFREKPTDYPAAYNAEMIASQLRKRYGIDG